MTVIQFRKSISFAFLLYCALNAQEKKIVTAPDALVHKFEAQLNQAVNKKMLAFAQSAGTNPECYLSSVSAFYTQTCQSPENRTWKAYLHSPALNLQKSIAYLQLSRTINQQIYGPHVASFLEKITAPEREISCPNKQEMYEIHVATFADDPVLKRKAAATFANQWAYKSVQMDLEAYVGGLKSLKDAFEKEKEKKLTLSEQTDSSLDAFSTQLNNNINSLRRAAELISHRALVQKIIANPFAVILGYIRKNNLEEKLKTLQSFFPFDDMNGLCKAQNNGNGLLHLICNAKELAPETKNDAISILKNQYDALINETNAAGHTLLDLTEEPAVKNHLIALGARKTLPRYDTPPASPINASKPKKDKNLKVSFTQD